MFAEVQVKNIHRSPWTDWKCNLDVGCDQASQPSFTFGIGYFQLPALFGLQYFLGRLFQGLK